MLIRRIPSLPTWTSAFRELDDARREMERLFDSLGTQAGPWTAGVFPPINVSETTESLFVRAELPGIRPDDLDLTVEDNTLTLAGSRKLPSEAEKVSYHRREREWGTFRRSFSLPVRVDADKVQARYADGILTVELPKAAEARPKQIAVQAGS
jgi:HSP20 family protein